MSMCNLSMWRCWNTEVGFRGAIITLQLQILISHFLFSLSGRLCSCHWNFRILVTDMVWDLFKRWEDPKKAKLRHSLISSNLLNPTCRSTTPKKNLSGRYWISSTNLHLVNMFQLWSYPTFKKGPCVKFAPMIRVTGEAAGYWPWCRLVECVKTKLYRWFQITVTTVAIQLLHLVFGHSTWKTHLTFCLGSEFLDVLGQHEGRQFTRQLI